MYHHRGEGKDTEDRFIAQRPKWWHRRTRMEKALFIISIIVIILCLALAIALAVILPMWLSQEEDKNVCLTPSCVASASTLIENMDPSANPCEDFFQYACGGFVERTVIPDEKPSMTVFELLADTVRRKIRVVIEKPKEITEPQSFWKLKDYYKACMNTDQIEHLGSKPLLDLINSLGGWPVISGDSWDASDFNWVKQTYKFRQAKLSTDYLFDLSALEDSKNTSYRLITLDQPSFGMPSRTYYMKGLHDPVAQTYYNVMVKIAVLLGAEQRAAEEQMMETFEFEAKLAEYALPKDERRNLTRLYHKMTVTDLYLLSSRVEWLEYFNKILQDNINFNEPVVVKVPGYIAQALNFISASPKRVVANYLIWRVVWTNIKNLDSKFLPVRLEYYAKLSGQKQQPERWLQCVSSAKNSMSVVMGAMYVRNYVDKEAKDHALEIVANIRNEFEQILNDITWMNPETKEKAKDKLAAIIQQIAYPDELLNNTLLDDVHQNMTITDNDHFGNVLSVTDFSANYAYSLLRKPVNKTDWTVYDSAAEINAYYDEHDNSIYFPAGILQGIFFDSFRPQYLNYGAMGFVIGHEITHGFDDRGRQLDKFGNINNWWDKGTDEKFRQKMQCIIEQFGNYTVPENGMRVNGINTQGENIADNGGLKESYQAYQKWVEQNGVEKTLPGMELTPKQLFWLNSANVWCSKERPEQLAMYINTGSHSPSRFRVNGAMSNFPQFAEDFNCPSGSTMNPENKCTVW